MLRSRGHDVLLVELPNPEGFLSTLGSLAVSPFNPLTYVRTKESISDFAPDIVHVHNTWFSLSTSVIAAARTTNTPVVTTIQNYRTVCPQAHLYRDGAPCTDCVGGWPRPGVKYRCYRGSSVLSALVGVSTSVSNQLGIWKYIAGVHVPSDFAKSMLIRGVFASEQVVSFPNAVEDPFPRPRDPSESPEVVFVGRLSPEKGLDLVLRSWDRVHPNALTLTVIGDGPAGHELRELAGPGVTFLGRVPPEQVIGRLLGARALLFPSRWFEVCPMVIVEALASGLPVFGHDLGATAELLDHSGPDVLVDPSDPSSWDRTIEKLRDDALMDRLGRQARSAYLARHTLDTWHEEHLKMYLSAVST